MIKHGIRFLRRTLGQAFGAFVELFCDGYTRYKDNEGDGETDDCNGDSREDVSTRAATTDNNP